MISLQFPWIDVDHDRALIASEGRRGGYAGQRGKDRSHAIEGQVLNLGERSGWTGKDQVAYRQGSRVIADDKRRHRSGWHKGAGTVDVGNCLRQRIAHIRAGMEGKAEESGSLNRLRLHALDSVDVQEVILVVIRDEPLHLLRTHASVWLRYVDDRQIEVGEDIDPGPHDGQNGRKRERHNKDENRDRPAERSANDPHRLLLTLPLALDHL